MSPPGRRALPPLPSSSEIHGIFNTAHLLYHRNKNQHRGAKWFKSLAMLRRETRKLAWEIEKVEKSSSDIDDDAEMDAGARKIITHLGREIIPRSYHAFSTVVADTQFSALGVVLIALVSRLSKVIGAVAYFPEAEQPESTLVDKERDEEVGMAMVSEDLGEVVGRDDVEVTATNNGDAVSESVESRSRTRKRMAGADDERERESSNAPMEKGRQEKLDGKAKKKKRRRKGNAIDDIFGDL